MFPKAIKIEHRLFMLTAVLMITVALESVPRLIMADESIKYKNFDELAMAVFIGEAENGDIRVQFVLGEMYRDGEGVEQDDRQAVYWYTKAAEQGHVDAQYILGTMFENGQGASQDYQQAARWYTKAAEQGNRKAQYNLALMYAEGRGVARNYQFAYIWSSLAASLDLPDTGQKSAEGFGEKAKTSRDFSASKLTPRSLTEAQELVSRIQYKIKHPKRDQLLKMAISEPLE
jgi:TPR repeat protein